MKDYDDVSDGAPYWADWFTDDEIDALAADDLIPLGFGEAELIEVSERAQKSEVYGTISDLSKDANGFRHRLNIDDYTLAELIAMRDDYAQQVSDQIDEERAAKVAAEKQRVAECNAKALAARNFNRNFNTIGNAFAALADA